MGGRLLQSSWSVTEHHGQGAGSSAVGRCGDGLWEEGEGWASWVGASLWGRAGKVSASPFTSEETALRALGLGLRPI